MIRPGYNAELDELQLIAADNKTWMQNFELKIKEATGIKTMKVGFNKVFGYYIEVSKGQSNSVPDYFVRKQTLVNAERFIVPELKEYENKILGAKEKIQSLEYYLFDELRTLIRTQITEIQPDPEGEQPPVELRNGGFSAPMEGVLASYSFPGRAPAGFFTFFTIV